MTTLSSRARRVPMMAAAAVLAISLAGCGDETDEGGTASDGGTSTSTASPDDTETPDTSTTSSPAATDSASADPSATTEPGTPGELPAWAPKIVTEGEDVTGLDFTGTPEPTDEVLVATVREGDGAPVEVGQTITADYFGSVYGSDTPFDESFSSQPFQAQIGVGQLIPGWDEKIPGVTVGSRIIMSIPPEFGYGDQDSGPIPGGSTLYFVIDIIAAEGAAG